MLTSHALARCVSLSVNYAKASDMLQYSKLANRSGIQLTIAPVLAPLQAFANLQRHHAASNARRPPPASANNAASSSSSNPNALRNITNANANATSRGLNMPTAATPSAATAAAAATSKSQLPQSTLAQLMANNAANIPLPSHARRRFGMAATQQREQQAQAINTQRAYDPNAAAQTQAPPPTQTQAAKKRRMVQQNL